jgi:hypothetical protein
MGLTVGPKIGSLLVTFAKDIRILGSTCIGNYASYCPEDAARMAEKLIELEDLAKAKKAEIKKIAQMKKVQAVMEPYKAKLEKVRKYADWYSKNKNSWLPRDLWYFVAGPKKAASPEFLSGRYSKPTFLLKAINRYMAQADEMVQKYNIV